MLNLLLNVINDDTNDVNVPYLPRLPTSSSLLYCVGRGGVGKVGICIIPIRITQATRIRLPKIMAFYNLLVSAEI